MEKKVMFSEKIMFCCSTNHQAVNLIPALKENVSKMVLFSTGTAKKWTENLKKVLADRHIELSKDDDVHIDAKCEQNVKELVSKINEYVEKYKDYEILLNIGGGQKLFTLAFSEVFINSKQGNIRIVYSEAQNHKLYSVKKDLDQSHDEEYKVDLSLEEILKSYGYKLYDDSDSDNSSNMKITPDVKAVLNEKKYVQANKSSENLKNDRLYQEIFYQMMMTNEVDETISYDDLINGDKFSKIVARYKPSTDPKKYNWINGALKKLRSIAESAEKITKFMKKDPATNIEDLTAKIEAETKNIQDNAEKVIDKNRVSQDLTMYCNDLADVLKNNFKLRHTVLVDRPFSGDEKEKIKAMFKCADFDEDSRLKTCSLPEKNGAFFEKMVTTEVCKLKDDPEVWQNIHEIWLNVKTAIGQDKKNDAEHDIVIVTKFGTLIILEVKSAVFDNKIAKGQERDVLKKSGPYGMSVIVGPLLSEMLDIEEDRKKKYPFVADAFFRQAEKVKNAKMKYWCFDQIVKELKEALK